MKSSSIKPTRRTAAFAALAVSLAGQSLAQENIFTSVAGNTLQWANNANWSLGVFPDAIGAQVRFNDPLGTQILTTAGAPRTIGVWTFDNNSEFEVSYSNTNSTFNFDNTSGNAALNVIGTTTHGCPVMSS